MLVFLDHSARLKCSNTAAPINMVANCARVCTGKSTEIHTYGEQVELFDNLVEWGHLSCLEFVDFIFDITTTRAVANELVRHRLCSFLQESQRYLAFTDKCPVIMPKKIVFAPPLVKSVWIDCMEKSFETYRALIDTGYVKPEDARTVLGSGVATKLVMKTNLRNLMHMFELRLANKAAWCEMRRLMDVVHHELVLAHPELEKYLKHG